jgi:hypothetical protein
MLAYENARLTLGEACEADGSLSLRKAAPSKKGIQ